MPAKSTGGAKRKTAKKAAKKTTKKGAESTTKKTKAKLTVKKAAKAQSTRSATKAAPKVEAAATKSVTSQKADVVRVRVRQIRSSIGRRRDFRETLRALGIRHHQGEVVVTRNPAIDGMLTKVSHLIRVTPEE